MTAHQPVFCLACQHHILTMRAFGGHVHTVPSTYWR